MKPIKSEYLDPKNYEKLYPIMQYQNVLAMRTALETGLRIDDVLSLTQNALTGTTIDYRAHKTGKAGKKKISKDLADKLRTNAKGGYLFKGKGKNTHRTRQTVWKDVKKACKQLGLKGQISPHSTRKSYAVDLRKRKGLAEVQKELQHTNAETTMIYAFSDMVLPTGNNDFEALAELIAEKVVFKLKRSEK